MPNAKKNRENIKNTLTNIITQFQKDDKNWNSILENHVMLAELYAKQSERKNSNPEYKLKAFNEYLAAVSLIDTVIDHAMDDLAKKQKAHLLLKVSHFAKLTGHDDIAVEYANKANEFRKLNNIKASSKWTKHSKEEQKKDKSDLPNKSNHVNNISQQQTSLGRGR